MQYFCAERLLICAMLLYTKYRDWQVFICSVFLFAMHCYFWSGRKLIILADVFLQCETVKCLLFMLVLDRLASDRL